MAQSSQEEAISEESFAALLGSHAQMFFRLADTLVRHREHRWGRRHYFQLVTEADTAESFLDDHGARYNRTFEYLVELTASARAFAIAGLRVSHLSKRIDRYVEELDFSRAELTELDQSIHLVTDFVKRTAVEFLEAVLEEARSLGVELPAEGFPSSRYESDPVQRKLPRNVDHEELQDEEAKIAEVASKFVQSCDLIGSLGVKRLTDAAQIDRFLSDVCSEEDARVFQATVHNLQSAYDTYIKNTVLEAKDERLRKLRGHASAALHFLEAVTPLTHFVERHEGMRNDATARRISDRVRRSEVRQVTLNHLLYWANEFMQRGRGLAENLLPSYTNVQELRVEIGEAVVLHARPASLIVGIVNKYGTPVEMEIRGETCNAGSMLSMMVTIGSHPDAREFVFRGDQNPLQDIQLLFESGLGESGLDQLPERLSYLRRD